MGNFAGSLNVSRLTFRGPLSPAFPSAFLGLLLLGAFGLLGLVFSEFVSLDHSVVDVVIGVPVSHEQFFEESPQVRVVRLQEEEGRERRRGRREGGGL